MPFSKITYAAHAVYRMGKRRIRRSDVEYVLAHGERIENYPSATPYPSYLMLGWLNQQPIHVVAADDKTKRETIVVTAYRPDPATWESDFKRRKP